MRSIRSDQRARFSLVLTVVILTGCASSQPSKFYQLNPVQNQMASIADVPSSRNVVIAVGPVRIPDYLDRPQIVTRPGENELKLSEFHRWAGSLESDVSRFLVEDISGLLSADRFSVVRWAPYPESQTPASYRVEVLVDRFEGTLGDSVLLKAQWEVFTHNRKLVLKRESLIREQIHGGSYDALVAAMSSALERLSRDIAYGIRSVFQREQTGG
ncbi:MAG: membrane integrity-associated transporter subunit PqiC [Thermodesulfobacteriota bacterium]